MDFFKKNWLLDFFGFLFYLNFYGLFGFFFKLMRLLLKVTKGTTGHQKWPKIGKNRKKAFFLPEGHQKPLDKGQSPPQELEVGPSRWPYLLVKYKNQVEPGI